MCYMDTHTIWKLMEFPMVGSIIFMYQAMYYELDTQKIKWALSFEIIVSFTYVSFHLYSNTVKQAILLCTKIPICIMLEYAE